jgi:hypothetical protein
VRLSGLRHLSTCCLTLVFLGADSITTPKTLYVFLDIARLVYLLFFQIVALNSAVCWTRLATFSLRD